MADVQNSGNAPISNPFASIPAASAEPRIRIIVNEGSEKEPPEVFVGVNGRPYKIQRGVEVSVPKSVVHVLENAVEVRWVKERDNQGNERSTPRRVRRFPFTVLGPEEPRGKAIK